MNLKPEKLIALKNDFTDHLFKKIETFHTISTQCWQYLIKKHQPQLHNYF